MTLQIGLSSGAFYPRILTEDVPDAAARLGISSLEIMYQTTGEYDHAFLRDLRARSDAVGTTIHSVHLFQPLHPLFSGYARRTEEAVDLFRRGVEGAAILGAQLVVWHGPTKREWGEIDPWPRLFAMTDRLAGICGESGLVLGIENVSWCAISAVRDAIRMAASLQSLANGRHVGFVFDSFQALEAGANPFMMLAAMEGRIANAHISDGAEEDPVVRHRLPGEGELAWPALIKAIDGAGYSGPMMLEAAVFEKADVDRVRALLDPLIASVSVPGSPCERPLPAGVRAGIGLFNRCEYYEAHEVIEHEWHAERGEIRALYQGILQIGVGLHHTRNGNVRGADLLLTDGIEKVSRFLPACQGVDTDSLAREAQQCLDQIRELGADRISKFDWSLVPVIEVD